MIKKITAVMLGICMLSMGAMEVSAADFSDGTEETSAEESLFTDGSRETGTEENGAQTESITALAGSMAVYAAEMGQEYQELKTQTNIAAERKRAQERAEWAAEVAEETAKRVEAKRVAHRQEIVDFALQFEGNPYVYGGTSLTNGTDCSGFTMSVFREFGYELPRVAAAQYEASRKKEISELEAGDLVFYGAGISHVALYIGDGKIIHASTSASGIKISDYDYETPAGVGTFVK